MQLSEVGVKAVGVIRETGGFIRSQAGKIRTENIEIKGEHDFVTFVDKTSEKMLIEGLSPLVPDAGFLAEEGTMRFDRNKAYWIIDPLDGTTNFIHNVPCYSISVALYLDEKPVLGIVYDVPHDDMYYACKEEGAFCNDRPIRVSSVNQLEPSLIVTGFPYHDYSMIEAYSDLLQYLMMHASGIRRPGSAALDLAYVAAGKYDVFFEYSLKPWDVAAGAFIVQQAGGKVSDFSGGNDFVFGKEIVAGNANLYDSFIQLTRKYFKQS